MPPKRRASPKGRPSRGKFKCSRCDRLVNGDERNNHVNKIHDGDKSVQFHIFCGDESKQPKLSFSKSVSKVPPSDDSTADGNGNLVLVPAAATVHESVPPAPVSQLQGEAAPPPPLMDLQSPSSPSPIDLQPPSSAGNLNRVTAAATVHEHEESVPLAPVSQVQGEAAPPPSPMDLQSPSSPSPSDLQPPSSNVPAGNLHRVTAAADADFHILNEIIKLSSRGHNNDVMIVCSDGCLDSSRVVLSSIFPFFKKLFDVQSYEEDAIISMPDFSCFEINAFLFDIERKTELVNISGAVLSLLSVTCINNAILVEREEMDQYQVGPPVSPSPLVERRNEVEVDITVNETHDEVKEDEDDESVVGAGPGHVGKRPQDVGSTNLVVPDHEEVESNEVPEEVAGAGPGHVGRLPQDVGSTHLASSSSTVNSNKEPHQPVLAKYAPYQDGPRVRDFNPQQFKANPWAEWNPDKKVIECFSCKNFLQNTSWSFSSWKSVYRLAKHGNSQLHKKGYMMWMAKKVSLAKKKSVASQVFLHHSENVSKNRNYVKVLIQSVAFMGQQNIPLRGHREDCSNMDSAAVENRGNFLELLALRSLDNDVLRSRFSSNSPKWLHHKYQNEIIDLLGNTARAKIIQDMKTEFCGEGMPYSIICDETSDNARHEQLSLCLSYLGPDGSKKESFVTFIKVDSTDGESLFNHVSTALAELGLDPADCHGLAMDGASNMSGKFRGLVTRMKAISPRAKYIHCMGHQLNLVIKDTLSEVKLLKDTLGGVQSLYTFIEASPKRHSIFMNVQLGDVESSEDNSFIRVLKSLSVTRWACHYEAVRAVQQEFLRIIMTLSQIENDVTSDASTSSTARALLKHVLDQKFIFGVEILKLLLAPTTKLSSELQSTKIDIRIARKKVQLVTTSLQMTRDSQHYNLLWEKTELVTEMVQKLLDHKELDYEVKLASVPRHAKFTGDVKTYFRAFFYEAADKIVSELNTRFNSSEHETLTKMAKIIYEKNVEVSDFEEVSRDYDLDNEKLQSEHEMLQHFKVKLTVYVF